MAAAVANSFFTDLMCKFAVLLTFFHIVLCEHVAYIELDQALESYELPPLLYGYNGLEPFLDNATLEAHHSGHHATYTKNLNAALQQWRQEEPHSSLAQASILEILQHLDEVPEKYRTTIRNQGGGFFNHCIYWAGMSENPSGQIREPQGALKAEIDATFGSFGGLYDEMSAMAKKLFGSGYVWLSRHEDGSLVLSTTVNQDSPVTDGLSPILVIDVWEHAYYLKHQFRRAVYIEHWWMVVDWDSVDQLDLWWKQVNTKAREEL